MNVYDFHRGDAPLLISIPHAGTDLPQDIARRLTDAGRRLQDTDWHVHRLYEFARELGASILQANCSRYVVDLNRSPDSASLYSDAPTSPVCPTTTFGGEPLYAPGDEPRTEEVAARVDRYWRPYHERIERELQRMRAQAGFALLWDAHSIASEVPSLFSGVLPEFNFGTRDDASCPVQLAESLLQVIVADGRFGAVLNGRFKGGYITQHYGRPPERIYAVQLELAQRMYMDEADRSHWKPQYARTAIAYLDKLLRAYVDGAAAPR